MNHEDFRNADPSKVDRNDPLLAWARNGWEDRRMGLGYRPEFETALAAFQITYENYRLNCGNVMAYGKTPAEWNSIGERHPSIGVMIRSARSSISDAIPRPEQARPF